MYISYTGIDPLLRLLLALLQPQTLIRQLAVKATGTFVDGACEREQGSDKENLVSKNNQYDFSQRLASVFDKYWSSKTMTTWRAFDLGGKPNNDKIVYWISGKIIMQSDDSHLKYNWFDILSELFYQADEIYVFNRW
jgi:hypothetical protein